MAGLIGLTIGVEREWSGHASGPSARFAGARTFFLLGLVGGISGLLVAQDRILLAVVLLAGSACLAVAAYVVASQQTGDRDGTTEAAALLVLGTGTLAGWDTRLSPPAWRPSRCWRCRQRPNREFIARIGETELRAALHFAVLAVVILPLLPQGPFGPGEAIRPRELWTLVLIFSAVNFIGYLARRAVGAERGYGIAGLLGGLVSSRPR